MEDFNVKYIFRGYGKCNLPSPVYFDNTYEDEWITDELSVKMIKDIDKSDVIGPHLVQSPILGPISTKELSGGVKTLMLMAFDDSGKFLTLQRVVITAQSGY